ncbi:MAG: alpha-mannosidase, partial [Anaerolineae bacterium]|nr:alpha-mannosidase [Anaerolineae bacterium]
MTKPVVHMIGNAHIDPVWLWRVDEGRQEVLSTYRSAITLMQETEGFVFSSGGAITYRWVQEDDPDLFTAIQRRVAEGRWEIVNGWLIQPDCNIPSGESFVRHGLYGQRAFAAMFGRRAVTGYNVDSFGHAGSLPQILRGCGLNNYVFFRPEPSREKNLPGTLFWWESDDGSRVLASRPPLHYPSHGGEIVGRIDDAAAQTPPDVGHVMCFYGIGNHGGGPTRANLASILAAMQRLDGPEVRFGRTDRFFELVRASDADLPIIHDELQHHARGCYTAVSPIKQYNRRCEHALLTAEKLGALAHRYCGLDYPQALLNVAWEKVLFNQFHDIMAGTSLREACQDACEEFEASLRTAQEIAERALAALSARIEISDDARTLFVFNPHPWAQAAPIEATILPTRRWNEDWRGEFRPGLIRLIDETGRSVPCQITDIEHSGGHYLLHLAFRDELPALGYRCYTIDIPSDAPAWSGIQQKAVSELENEYLHLRFDPASGQLVGLHDKRSGVELLRAPLAFQAIDDPSDTWSHDVVSFDQIVGAFEVRGKTTLIEDGPARQRVRAVHSWGCSTLTADYVLYHGDDQVYLDLRIDWHEQIKMLKLALPLALDKAQSTASIPYGHIQRVDDGGEEPCQEWVDLSGARGEQKFGLTVLNDGKYGYDALGGMLRMSLLRSPVFAFHTPRQIEPGVTYHYTDQGEQRVRLA